MRTFLYFFGIQFLAYGLLCWNYRSIAQANYPNILASDGIFAFLNFTVIKKVSEAAGRAAILGYVAGGMCGSLVSVWITKHFLG